MRTWFFCPLFPMCICFGSRQTTDALATCGADELREKRIHTYWTVQDRQYCVYYHNIDFFVVQAETKRLQSCFACVHGYEMEVFVKTRRTRMRRLGELTLTRVCRTLLQVRIRLKMWIHLRQRRQQTTKGICFLTARTRRYVTTLYARQYYRLRSRCRWLAMSLAANTNGQSRPDRNLRLVSLFTTAA